jgi:hypothetical protein
MAPTGTYIGTGTGEMSESKPGNKIVNRRMDNDAPTGEGEIVTTRDGLEYRVVLNENAPNVIRQGHVYGR